MYITLHLLILTPQKSYQLFAPQRTSVPTARSVSNGLLQFDWLTAFTRMKWKCTYVNKNCGPPKKFKSRFLVKCFVLSSDIWRVYSWCSILSIFTKFGGNFGNVMNPKRVFQILIFSLILKRWHLHQKLC